MRTIKIHAVIIPTALSAFFLFSSVMPLAKGHGLKSSPAGSQSVIASFTNVGSQTFQPDQAVEVKWILEGNGVQALEDNPWSECEVLFSTDNGQNWARITPELSVHMRSFNWIVPKVSTQQALLLLRIGVQGDGDFYAFRSKPFTILAPWGLLP
jgi:hypothetical protein